MNKYEHIPPVVENLKNPQIIEYIEDLNKVSKTEFSGMETELTKVFAENKKASTARTDSVNKTLIILYHTEGVDLCKQLAKRKLSEFHRWCRVAVLHYDMIQVDENWTIKLFEFDPEDYKGKVHGWQREAPNEVNEILKAINAIAKPRHRAILIMSYILPEKIRSVEQAQRIGIAASTYYLAKNEALKEFVGQYRDGSLLQYLDS